MKRLYPFKAHKAIALFTTAIGSLFTKNTLLLIVAFLAVIYSNAQTIYSVSNPGNFGIDGDIYSDQRQQGSFTAAGSQDWFQKAGGTGIGVFDTLQTNKIKAQLSKGTNYSGEQRMIYNPYSIHNNYLMLDGLYTRDQFGLSMSNSTLDKTAFVSTNQVSSKNFESPNDWGTTPSGTSIPSKVDIIDTYVNMRRIGNSIDPSNPSNLIVYMAASSLGTEGDRYFDFELFRSTLDYDTKTGVFTNTAPATTGGRDAWIFNTDGSLKNFGNLSISFSFNSSTVTDISVYIWVDYKTYNSVVPKLFNFAGEFNGPTTGYGYAKIIPKSGAILPAWGAVNTSVTAAPVWGTSSKSLGTTANNYYSDSYGIGQLAETSIDLTALGIDPIFSSSFNPCAPAFRRVMVKSRSSSSFSSALQDFVGPFQFLDAPTIPATIAVPSVLNCSASNAVLKPSNYINGAYYTWSTVKGNIVSSTDTAFAIINQPGKYYLTASRYQGCAESKDSVVVSQDLNKPIASASYTGSLTSDFTQTVTLHGGDTTASNYKTPFGGSQGLLWSWSGPNNFSASAQDPTTATAGMYYLTVTEKRNGCIDTASVEVVRNTYNLRTLAVTFIDFKGIYNTAAQRTELKWKIAQGTDAESVQHFEVEKSGDGIHFTKAGYVLGGGSTGLYEYRDKEALNTDVKYYRIKGVSWDGYVYSSIARVGGSNGQSSARTYVSNSEVIVQYTSAIGTSVSLSLLNSNGQVVNKKAVDVQAGINTLKLGCAGLPKGIYFIQIGDKQATQVQKVLL